MESNLEKINHIVVLMLENRSFDNILGWLGTKSGEPQKVNGVSGKNLSNPIPPYADKPKGGKNVPVSKGHGTINPSPDPGEEYYHVNTQLYGLVNPPDNRYEPFNRKPYNLPNDGKLPPRAPMNGFVTDYIDNFNALQHRMPTYEEYKVVMECFDEDDVPVISKLAQEYAVFDAWHCSVPSQTFCNRSFVHTATSNGAVTNTPYFNWLFYDSPTIFNRIEEKKDPNLTWKVYYDKLDVISITGLLHQALWKDYDRNFKYMEDFENDAANGTLPSYSFIEPRLLIDHNDQHPPADAAVFGTSSVLAGELLINRIYQALRRGKNWEHTLFIITFDEHGGCYDHVAPPAAIPPDANQPTGQYDFKFDRLGVRVPTVMISPYIERGTIVSDIYDHTSIIRTICKRWNLDPLTERDRYADSFEKVLNVKTPRTDSPVIHPRPYKVPENVREEPLNDLQRAILFFAAGYDDALQIERDENLLKKTEDLFQLVKDEGRIAHIKNTGQAIEFMNAFANRRTRHSSFQVFWKNLWKKIRSIFG
jgi:phospholipase C